MARNGENIFKRKDGRWEGRIVVGHRTDGLPIYRSVFAKTQRELMPRLNQLKEYTTELAAPSAPQAPQGRVDQIQENVNNAIDGWQGRANDAVDGLQGRVNDTVDGWQERANS